jgi:hypothetical protein
MGQYEVFGIQRLAPDLGVKIGAAGAVAARLQDFIEGQRLFGMVVGELVVSQPD